MSSRRSTWLEGRVEVLLGAFADLGMSVSHTAAAELIQERVQWVRSQARISPTTARRYLTDEALGSLARKMVISFAEETPGSDVLEAPRSAPVPLSTLGRCVAGLAESINIRLCERDDAEHLRDTVGQLSQTLSALGQITAEHDPGAGQQHGSEGVMMPPGLLHRAARYLEVSAQLVRDDGILPEHVDPAHAEPLAATLAKDAAGIRFYAGE